MTKPELYFSIDVEADGPIPIQNSMLSFGAAVFEVTRTGMPSRVEGNLIATYEATLDLLPGAIPDPATMVWWAQAKNRDAWAKARANTRPAEVVIPEFVSWVKRICRDKYNPVFVAYPAGFDFTYLYVYMMKFAKESPFSFSALDMKSFAMGLLDTDYRETIKRRFPKSWSAPQNKHEHVALSDAIEQGHIFVSMLQHREALHDRLEEKAREATLSSIPVPP